MPSKSTRRMPRKKWQVQRRRVWIRDDCKCVRCGKELLLYQAHIDHIIPVSSGGRSYMRNLRTLCVVCHATRGEPSHHRLWLMYKKKGIITGKEELWT